MEEQPIEIEEIYSQFMSYSAVLEAHLRNGLPLKQLQADALSATIYSLRTSIDAWRQKHG